MIAILLRGFDDQAVETLSRELAGRAITLRAQDQERALNLLWSVPIGVIVTRMPALTSAAVEDFRALAQAGPEAVQVAIVPAAALQQIRTEDLLNPDFWLLDTAEACQQAETLQTALGVAELKSRGAAPNGLPRAAAGPGAPTPSSAESQLFQRLLSGLAHGLDVDRLLHTYVEAAVSFVNCTGYCLLWRAPEAESYSVYTAQGLPPEVVEAGRLLPGDPLPRWCLQNCRVLTRAELTSASGVAAGVAGELDLLRGQVAVPLLAEGRLLGILVLGEKVVGGAYAGGELESLFILSNYVAVQAQSLELHAELRRNRSYMGRIVSGMSSGVVTLGRDEKIAVCNPYAAAALGLNAAEIVGRDLRCLPSPLGDLLYAVLRSPGEAIGGREITVRGGQLTLWVSTSALLDETELPVGAILLLHDLTDQIALATERHRRERLDLLTQIIGTIAHGVRTPLTAVRTYIELASSSVQDSELEAFRRDTVSPQLERLNDLINQMVHMVQQPEPNFELVQPEVLVEQALRQVFASEPEGQRPRLEVEGALPRIIADPGPTQEAIVYLTRYLWDSQDSPLHLWLAAEGTAEEACVSLRISSLQPPRREIELEEIFDPVSALQASSTDLGPVISRRILENQGGKVEARLYEGNLEFRVLFPVPFLGSTTLRESSYMPPAF